jgi:hypothetical protein
VPKEARDAMQFVFADDMSQVIAAALEPADAPAEHNVAVPLVPPPAEVRTSA